MPKNKLRLPELLAPAGSPEALAAAIEGGADAVYFGSVRFSARMRARNFNEAEMADAISLARTHGVRTYITVNTRVRDGELSELLDTVFLLNEAGADALIVADLGVAAAVRRRFPDLALHASTQFSGAAAKDAALLSSLGFSRMVCPRELSLSQLAALTKASPIEIEMFIHGAHCVSYSGQCLLSYVMGGRSGNRGECAQPCRLPYTVTGKSVSASSYPLSLKDMCLAGHMGEILTVGVSSLKIEGRQKSPEYVYGVTKMYRTLLDEGRNATVDEVRYLADLFSRDGFSDGYLQKHYAGMLGVRRFEDAESSKAQKPFSGLTKTVPVKASLAVLAGHPVTLSLTAGGKTVTVAGDIPSPAKTQPLTGETAKKSISKFGGTPFSLETFTECIEDGLFCTPATLNALRRAAVAALTAPPKRRVLTPAPPVDIAYTAPQKPRYTAEFLETAQIPSEAESFFDEIHLPLSLYKKGFGVSLPAYAPDGRWDKMCAALTAMAPTSVLCHSPAEIVLARDAGHIPVASLRNNVFNGETARVLVALGTTCVTPSPELPLGAMRAIPGAKSVIAYGRLPLMLTLRCAISDGGTACTLKGKGGFDESLPDKGHLCFSSLKDRTGAAFPLVGMRDCTNTLYNAVPIYMADRKDTLSSLHAHSWHFVFSTETKEEVRAVIHAYKNGETPPDSGKIRRLK